jgi:hypothetical protein
MPPSVAKTTLLLRVGSAVAVLVEGEETGGDAWIYGDKWFAKRALDIRFVPQTGWGTVVEAVAQLRSEPPPHPVFGLVDRDCTPEEELDALVPGGVLRSRLYSVENYLLDPACWLEVFSVITSHRGGPPVGWRTAAEVELQVIASYRECVDGAAFNRTIGLTKREHSAYPNTPSYVRGMRGVNAEELSERLRQWGSACGHSIDLAAQYLAERESLRQAKLEELATKIDGKFVLDVLLRRFQDSAGLKPQIGRAMGMSLYLDKCPDPPPDAVEIVTRILQHAGRA